MATILDLTSKSVGASVGVEASRASVGGGRAKRPVLGGGRAKRAVGVPASEASLPPEASQVVAEGDGLRVS